jgi:hypothetical protein
MTRGKTEEFKEVLGQYVQEGSGFYDRVVRAKQVLDEVRERSGGHGHGIALILARDSSRPSALEKALEDATDYNNDTHSIYEPKMGQVADEHRELDGAVYVDERGEIRKGGVELPLATSDFKRAHGIPKEVNIRDFLGYDASDGPAGFRNRSALNGSYVFGKSVVILLLGENGEISMYYNGDRPYNSAGRKVRWNLAENGKILHLPVCQQGETHPEYQLPRAAAGPM